MRVRVRVRVGLGLAHRLGRALRAAEAYVAHVGVARDLVRVRVRVRDRVGVRVRVRVRVRGVARHRDPVVDVVEGRRRAEDLR